jgi:hypothetical protein
MLSMLFPQIKVTKSNNHSIALNKTWKVNQQTKRCNNKFNDDQSHISELLKLSNLPINIKCIINP